MLWWTLRQLRSADVETRRQAAAKLGISGNTPAVPPLVDALKDPHGGVRAAAVVALGKIGDPSAVEPLLAAARESESARTPEDGAAIRLAVITALGTLGSSAADALAKAAGDKNARVREVAVAAVAGAARDRARPILIQALRDDRSNVRQAAALALPHALGHDALAPLVDALGHKDALTRRSAALALGGLGGAQAAAALITAARDKDHAVREATMQALARIGTRPAIDALLAAYASPDRDLRQAAATALKSTDWTAADGRERAIQAVLHGRLDDAAREGEAALGPLVTALGDKDNATRRAAAKALGDLTDEASAAPLVGALADYEEPVRLAALQSLRRLGPLAFVQVVGAMDAKASAVRSAAKELLAAIPHAPGVVGSMLDGFSGQRITRGEDAVVRIAGVDAVEHARHSAGRLDRILTHAIDRIPASELHAVSQLPDLELVEHPDDPSTVEPLSCDTLRGRARRELERRGHRQA